MPEMVERVARQLWDCSHEAGFHEAPLQWEAVSPKYQEIYRVWARGVIKAMRTPNITMIDAGLRHTIGEPARAWEAMIDAALSGS